VIWNASPESSGDGAFRAMQAAVKRAGIKPQDIDYINAHGTSTQLGDEIELAAVHRLLADKDVNTLSMSSTKSAIGHLLGAAGAVEAIFCTLAIRDQIVPPTLNLDHPSVETSIDLVPHKARKREVEFALSNSFGFGGTNACLILRAVA
jgi:3-oxoacyl-[acyl-carrier-protein] synthase II